MPIDIMNPEAWQNWDRLATRPRESTTAGYMSCQLALKKSEKIINMIKLLAVSLGGRKKQLERAGERTDAERTASCARTTSQPAGRSPSTWRPR